MNGRLKTIVDLEKYPINDIGSLKYKELTNYSSLIFHIAAMNWKYFSIYGYFFNHLISQTINSYSSLPSSLILALIFVAEIFCISSGTTISSIL